MRESRPNAVEPTTDINWVIVLVQPARGGNIGAAARAMNTMGFNDLRIVDSTGTAPVDGAEARAFAHGSTQILDRSLRYVSLSQAVEDCDTVIGTTGRRRGKRKDLYTPEELIDIVRDGPEVDRIALVFGPEESGLSNDELDLCDIVSAVPMRSSYPSLNLGQAVMVYTYALAPLLFYTGRPIRKEAESDTIHALHKKARALLPLIGFDPGRAITNRIIERITVASAEDARLIHSVLNAIEVHLHQRDR